MSQTVPGTGVKVWRQEKNERGELWFEIETPDSYHGWVAGASVRLLKDGEQDYAAGRVFEVISLFAKIYAGKDITERKPLVTVTIGVRLAVGDCGERWCAVTLPDGRTGWVQNGRSARRRPSPAAAALKRGHGLARQTVSRPPLCAESIGQQPEFHSWRISCAAGLTARTIGS